MTRADTLGRLLLASNCIHPQSVFVRLSSRCNQNCGFCNIRGQADFELNERQALGALVSALKSRTTPVIQLTGGEPTLRRDLFRLIKVSVAGGAGKTMLQTNGMMLSTPGYAGRLKRAGLDGIIMSLHGADSAVHDRLTATPGSFSRTTAGLRAALDAGLKVWVNIVFSSHNLGQGSLLAQRLCSDASGIRGLILSTVQPHGLAGLAGATMVPRLAEAASAIRATIAECDRLRLSYHLSLCENPLCFIHQVTGAESVAGPVINDVKLAFDRNGCTGCALRSFMSKDKIKVQACTKCAADTVCDGVWRAQVLFHGDEELTPLTEAEAAGGLW